MQSKWMETFMEQQQGQATVVDGIPRIVADNSQHKIPVASLKKGDRILTGGGHVAEVTGHRTKNETQIRLVSTRELDWLSNVGAVHPAD